MSKVAIVIPGSATPAFYSQIAVISAALRQLQWRRWEPSIHAFFGEHDARAEQILARWLPYLADVEIFRVSEKLTTLHGNWAQVDATIRYAPRDADVIMSLDADTLPVGNFEDVLDRVLESDAIAGVIAHAPFPTANFPHETWRALAAGRITKAVEFGFLHTLVEPEHPASHRQAPFYLNAGVVFYSRACFDTFAPRYLELRPKLANTMEAPDFSGQAALTLSVIEEDLCGLALPMRYNFPNDPRAERLQAGEMEHVVVHHYQHRGLFDRHRIFATAQGYADFLSLPLSGINRRFQDAVKRILGETYPFPDTSGPTLPASSVGQLTVTDHRQVPGFFYEGDYLALDEIVAQLPAQGNLIEVGCLMGRSTTAWAESFARARKDYAIHVIDSFAATYRDYAEHLQGDAKLIREALLPHRSQESLFVEFVRAYPNISYTKMRFSTSFEWDEKLHCVFEDSDHGRATLSEALPFWWHKLEPGGVLSGHDYHPDHPDVIAEVDALARTQGVSVRTYPDSSIWSIRKPVAA